MSSIEPDDGGREINSSKEIAGGFIVAGGDSAILLEFADEILDEMASLIKVDIS